MKRFLLIFVILIGSAILNAQTIPLNPDPYWSHSFDGVHLLIFVDINNDGYPELAGAREGYPNLIFMNNAGVIDSLPFWSSNDSDPSFGIACGDYDNDGDLDIAIANPQIVGGRLKLYRNDNGSITQDAVWSSSSKGGMTCAWGDVDNDGDLDLASADMMDYPAVHYNNNGTLETTPSWQASDYNIDEFCVWADINKDGWLDLVVGNYNVTQPVLRVYFNDTTNPGTLKNPASWISQTDPNSFYTAGISAGDIDKNGWVDILSANGAGVAGGDQVNTIYYNNSGVLDSLPTWYSGDVFNSVGSVLGDINGDGYLEWAVANLNGPSASVYLNNNGVLVTMPWNTNTTGSDGIDLGDVDRDGIVIKEDTLMGDGDRKLFYLSVLPVHQMLEITVAGTPVPVTDYACDLKSGWLTFKYTPPSGTQIIFEYEYSIDMELATSGIYIFENTNAGINEKPSNSPCLRMNSFPNPFMEYSIISFSLPTSNYVTLKIFNCSGRLVKRWDNYLNKGKHSFIIGRDLKPGVYFSTLKIKEETYRTKIVKVKGGIR